MKAMPKFSLGTQLLIIITVIFTIAFGMFAYAIYNRFADFAVEQAKQKLEKDAEYLAFRADYKISTALANQLRETPGITSEAGQQVLAILRQEQSLWPDLEIYFSIYFIDRATQSFVPLLEIHENEEIQAAADPLDLTPIEIKAEDWEAWLSIAQDPALFEPIQDETGLWINLSRPIYDEQEETTSIVVDAFIRGDDQIAGVRREVRDTILLVSLFIYPFVLGVVFFVGWLATRAVKRVIIAAKAIDRNEPYDAAWLAPLIKRNDELGTLARTFDHMAKEVKKREDSLKQEVVKLKIEIDVAKQREQVAQIIETDYFKELKAKSNELRDSKQAPTTESRSPAPASESDSDTDDYFGQLRSKAATLKTNAPNESGG